MINASGPGAVLRKKCNCEEDEEKEDEVAGRVILNVDAKLLLLCGVRIADLAWAGERDKVVAMAGSRVWGYIVRFVVEVVRGIDRYTDMGSECIIQVCTISSRQEKR